MMRISNYFTHMQKNVISISNGTIVRVFLWVALFYLLFYIKALLISILVGVLFASTIEPAISFLERKGIKRVLGVGIIYISSFVIAALVVFFALPKIIADLIAFSKYLPSLLESVTLFGFDFGAKNLALTLKQATDSLSQTEVLNILKNFVTGAGNLAGTASGAFSFLLDYFLAVIFSFYLAVEPNGVNKFLSIITPIHYEEYVQDLWARSQKKISGWAKGQFLVALIMGFLAYVAMLILGIPHAGVFGFLTFLGEMIPMVGLFISAPFAIITAYFGGGGIEMALITLGVYLGLSIIENYIVYPKIMDKVLGVPAMVTLIAVIVGAKLAGFWGVVLAVPISAVVMEVANDILKHKLPSYLKKDLQ